MKFLTLLLLLIAAPAYAQDIDRAKAIMREVAAQCPRAYANAHASHNTHPERLDYIILATQALKKFDARFGMNGKRGNASDPSADAIAYGSGRSVLIVDVIVGAGEHGTNLNAITWNDVTGFGPGVYVDPDSHRPVVACGVVPAPLPTPTPTPTPVPPPVDLSLILARLDILAGEINILAQMIAHEAVMTQDAIAAVDARVNRVHLDVLAAVDLGRQQLANPPTYKGGVFGIPVVLRPEPRP